MCAACEEMGHRRAGLETVPRKLHGSDQGATLTIRFPTITPTHPLLGSPKLPDFFGVHEGYDVQERLFRSHKIEVPTKASLEISPLRCQPISRTATHKTQAYDGKLYVRISCHVYNTLSDYEKLGNAVLSMMLQSKL